MVIGNPLLALLDGWFGVGKTKGVYAAKQTALVAVWFANNGKTCCSKLEKSVSLRLPSGSFGWADSATKLTSFQRLWIRQKWLVLE